MPATTQSTTPSPISLSVVPHAKDPLPTPTPAAPPGSPPSASAAEGADPVPAPVSVPPSATEPEILTEEADSARAPASPSASRAADSDQPPIIPRPTYKEERQSGFPFELLGIGRNKADREPLRTCVTEVYRGQVMWRTSSKTYKELPWEERGTAEQQLQSELEKLYPATTYTAISQKTWHLESPSLLVERYRLHNNNK